MKAGPLRSEEGFALVVTLLILVLLSGLGVTALIMSTMDASVSGYYRTERTGEATADAALELIMAMIFSNDPLLQLPVNIDTSGTWPKTVSYQDDDLNLEVSINYKTEDSINYHTTETYADEVVRYGQDYNFATAQKAVGKQPVYTVEVREVTGYDGGTPLYGARAEADLISQLGFRTPAAIFALGDSQFQMRKVQWVTEEKIAVTSGAGTPALATTLGAGSVFIQHAVSKSGPSGGVVTNQPVGESWVRWDYTDNQGSGNNYAKNQTSGVYLYDDVYTDAEIAAEIAAGNFNNARDRQFCLLGVGDPLADLDGFGTFAEAKQVFNFDQSDPAVVQYDYDMQGQTLEDMVGASFSDLRELADQVLSGDETVQDVSGANVPGKNLSGMTFGTAADPEIVFFESNMDDAGNYTGDPTLTLVTTAGTFVEGYGILVINGDADIQGSINWKGLMIVRGDLVFKPWQGGSNNDRSDLTLATRWNGWIMIGKDLDLWTYWGGSVILGYSTTDAADIKGIISATIPHKVLSWRKVYD